MGYSGLYTMTQYPKQIEEKGRGTEEKNKGDKN